MIPKEKKRMKLPVFKDPNEKISIIKIIMECIGKDLTKMAVPGTSDNSFLFGSLK